MRSPPVGLKRLDKIEGAIMLTYEECLEMCDLSDDEIEAIAEHEHVEPMIAMALGKYLVEHDGCHQIKQFILDDIEVAKRQGNTQKMALLTKTLCHFMTTHPECCHETGAIKVA